MFGRWPGSGEADVAMSVSLCPRRGGAGRMIDLLQIDHRGEGIELLEHVVRPAIGGERRHRPTRVRRVAEGDGTTRTRLRARDGEFIGLQIAMLGGREGLRLANPLDAEGALLHDALAAHRDVRIELPVEWLRERVLLAIRLAVPEPVEVADLVRAVVRAVARADAAVVDLDVQSVRRVVRRVDRAHRLARRVAAMLAE